MRAVVIEEPHAYGVAEVPDPEPGPEQVVVEVDSCGICGTDQHIVAGDNPNARYPLIPGHEFAGTVVAVGRDVTRLAAGQRVGVDPSWFCGACAQCRAGWPNLCPYKGGYGTARPGGFAEYVAVAQTSCEPLPDGVPLAWGAVAEPLACVLHGVDKLGSVLGLRILVVGAGPIGLLATRLLSAGGARTLDVVDVNPRRLTFASDFGATGTGEHIEEIGPETGYDVVVDATGVPAAIEEGLTRLARGGRYLLLGVTRPDAKVQIDPFAVNWRELTILGSMAIRHSYGRAVDLMASGVVDGDRLITGRFPLDGFGDALDALRSGSHLKVQVTPR